VNYIGIFYITIFVLCSLIYVRIRAVRRELLRYDQLADVHFEKRAFGTIRMMLATQLMLATLSVFFVPYMTLHVLSLNLPAARDYLHGSVVVYYMNLLPYLKFASDPVIYGLRMREVKVGLMSVVERCCALGRSIVGRLSFCSRDEDDVYEMTSLPRRRDSRHPAQVT